MFKYVAALFLLFSFALADVGPSPPKPEITVTFLINGSTYAGPVELAYVCAEQGSGSSPVDTRETAFTCENGVCRNEMWFYKFNPCYYPKSGYFRYSFAGGANHTTLTAFAFDAAGTYTVELNVDSGTGKTATSTGMCPTSVSGLVALGAVALLARRTA